MNDQFNPKRLKFARARRQLTMKALADEVGLTSRTISSYESNREKEIPEETLSQIASVLKYPTSFFYGEDIEPIEKETVSFRALSKMRAAQRDAAIAAGELALLFNDWAESNYQLPRNKLPDLGINVAPEEAAVALREKWCLGEQSIKSVIHLLESKGIRVFSLMENNHEVDAYSFWKDETPFIFLNTKKSGERSRFDACHELGHLILHKHGAPTGRQAEIEANRFASALLMPEGAVKADAPVFASINHLVKLKKLWDVSVAALVRRLYDLSIITDWQYNQLSKELAKLGYYKKEPNGISNEKSVLLSKVVQSLKDDGITTPIIAGMLNIPVDELAQLLFGVSIVSNKSSTPNNESTKGKATLRLVTNNTSKKQIA